MNNFSKIFTVLFVLIMQFQIIAQTVIDIDGNVYNTVVIGTQMWMKENLKVKKFSKNINIQNETDNLTWGGLSIPAYCDYGNNPSNSEIYGRLYNWYAVNDTNDLCPNDWHIPSDNEWTILMENLGGDSIAGGKMKEAGLSHWLFGNIGATNSSNFTALPAGYRWSNVGLNHGMFNAINGNTGFWSSTESINTTAFMRYLYPGTASVSRISINKSYGLSVRCLSDNNSGINKCINNTLFFISPNPAINGKFKVQYENPLNNNFEIEIYNLIGEMILKQKKSNDIDLSDYPKQVYIVKVIDKNNVYCKKVIVQ